MTVSFSDVISDIFDTSDNICQSGAQYKTSLMKTRKRDILEKINATKCAVKTDIMSLKHDELKNCRSLG